MSGFWRGRRVLITGGGGFLGSYLARILLERGAEVFNLDVVAHSPCLRVHGLADRVRTIEGSILDSEGVERTLRENRIQTVFHLAGQSMIEGAAEGPIQAFDLNVRGTWIVLDAARRSGIVEGVVTASSNHAYGAQERSPFPETAALNQLDPYGASKACADIVTRSFAMHGGVNAAAVRNVNTFGEGDPHLSHIVTGSIMSLLRDEPPIIRSDGSPVKAYLHVSDTMSAYVAVAERVAEPGVNGEAFNVTPAEPVSVLNLVGTIVRASGKTHLAPVVEATDLSQKGYFEHLSGARIRERLGWEPALTLEEGVKRTYDWFAEHGDGWLTP